MGLLSLCCLAPNECGTVACQQMIAHNVRAPLERGVRGVGLTGLTFALGVVAVDQAVCNPDSRCLHRHRLGGLLVATLAGAEAAAVGLEAEAACDLALGSPFVFRLALAKKTMANTPARNSKAPAAFNSAVSRRKAPPGF